MNAAVFRACIIAAWFAALLVGSDARAQSCECTHQGAAVSCPSGLPSGSRSVQFVQGGTQWATPSGQSVFVPQTSFACNGPSTLLTMPPASKPTTTAPVSPKSDRDSSDRGHDALIGAGAAAILEGMRHKRDRNPRPEVPPPEPVCDGPFCASSMREDPVLVCYRHTSVRVSDGRGVTHSDSLYDQLVQATGVMDARLAPACARGICEEPGYDCGGTFYDGAGKPVHAPPFAAAATRTEKDLKRWKASVSNFFRTAFLDPHQGSRLSPGKADVCTRWSEVRSQREPDRSVLDALDTLQQVGGESTHPDFRWIDHIQSAGDSQGCGTLPLPPGHDMDSFVVPEESARSFLGSRVNGLSLRHFISLRLPSLDGPDRREVVVFAEAEGGFSGDECARTSCTGKCDPALSGRTCAESPPPRTNATSLTGKADPDCDAAIGACMGACQASNQALSRRCIEAGGEPIGGMCEVNVQSCSCSQTAPDCRRK